MGNQSHDKLMTDKEAYDKAIEAYQFHIERYNIWMNYYSVFVGALFIALYSVMDKSSCFNVLKSVITLMGEIASICWLLSFRGYYSWLKSWIAVIQFYEKRVTQPDSRVYLLIKKEEINKYGYSTQKVTLCFIYMTLIAWVAISAWMAIPLDNKISTITLISSILFFLLTIYSEIKPHSHIFTFIHSNVSGFEYINNKHFIL